MLKIMLQKDFMCFVLFLKDVLEPLMKLSLRLQRPGSTLADGLFWVETTADLLPDIKSINSDQLSEVLTSGCFGGITLKGRTPTLAYRDGVVDGFVEALVSRFQLGEKQKNVINSTHILSFSRWPKPDSPEFQVFGVDEVKTVTGHFADTLMRANPEFDREDALQEWRMLKRVLSKRHGSKLTELTWDKAGVYDEGFQHIMLVIDILLALPPTSVNCETTFSQMKLVKTIRRANLNTTTVNDLLLVKLESPPVANFNPDKSIDQWLATSMKPRKMTYHRKPTAQPTAQSSAEDEDREMDSGSHSDQITDMDIDTINDVYQTEDELKDTIYSDYQDEKENSEKVQQYAVEPLV